MLSTSAGAPAGKVKPFGPNDELLYTLSDVRGGASRVGAILWGLGLAEVKTARTLAKKGIVSMQLRINGPDFYDDTRRNEIYRRSGIDYSTLAMDKLAAERGVTSFILMGNCACANLCFHAAVRDPRVVGLILTNPYIAKAQLLRAAPLRKLAHPSAWKRLFTDGRARVRARFAALRRSIADRLGGTERADNGDASQTPGWQAIELPEDFGRALRSLCNRGLKILIACTASDDSFHYLGRRHRTELRQLEAKGDLRFTSVSSSAHVFSKNDVAAGLLNDSISAWVDATTFCAAEESVDRDLDVAPAIPNV